MLRDEFMTVLQACNRHALLHEALGFTRRLGFDTMSVMTVVDRFGMGSEFECIDNTPNAWRKTFEDLASAAPWMDRRHGRSVRFSESASRLWSGMSVMPLAS